MSDAGWYPDPQQPGTELYYDGRQWTAQRRPTPATPSAAPSAAPPPATEQWSAPVQPGQQWSAPPPAAAPPQPAQPPAEPQWGVPVPTAPPAAEATPPQWVAPAPAWGAPGQPLPPGAPMQPGQPGQPWDVLAPPPKRRRRKPLIAAAAVVVLAGAGVGAWVLFSGGDSPSYTYRGTAISSPDKVLSQAEATVTALVKSRHGVQNGETRCYFVLPKAPAQGAKKTDVDSNLNCGPVLFVDGDASKQYLPVSLSAATPTGGKVVVTPTNQLSGVDPVAVPAGSTLSRPDGKGAPSGAGGLKVPAPPAAPADALVSAPLGPVPAPETLSNAQLVGLDTTVQLIAAGVVPRYGSGDSARSAAPGHQLIAFQLNYSGGDVNDAGNGRAQLVIGSGKPQAIPDTDSGDDWDVVSVPTGTAATLQFSNGGYTQTLSLPAAKPGAANLAVLGRKNRVDQVNKNVNVSIGLSEGGNSGSLTWQANVKGATIDFWVPNHTSVHASSPSRAMLSLLASYQYSDKPGTTYGFDPGLVQLKLADGTVVHARNVAGSGYIYDVFDVPANLTSATLQITGTTKIDGVDVTISNPVSIPLSFPAG